ncbi:MAG: hypothetical protein K2X81_29255 [Candidatus Obscuribacterales bacterium]|nr:hypothetical protein [Candidatus Obscuribacterales bacterium]
MFFLRSKLCISVGIIGFLGLANSCMADEPKPAINASGAGMTNEQLLQTRPILSGLKAIVDCEQSVAEIKDKAAAIVEQCTLKAPDTSANGTTDFYGAAEVVSGPFSKMEGKYYKVPKWKLLELNKGINKQRSFLAETIIENQQDQRTLRASEPTREQIESLRAEARTLNVQVLKDADGLNTLLANSASTQSSIVDSAKALIRSAGTLQSKLKQMEKVLKREKS